MISNIATAYIFSFFAIIVMIFQLVLALGAPFGEMAMGGKFPGKFPPKMRVAALVQIFVLIAFTLIVLTNSGIILKGYYSFSESAIWVVTMFSALGVILNIVTPSKKERIIWAPISIVMFLCVSNIAMN